MLAVAVVLGASAGGCQLVLGIDQDLDVLADASARADASMGGDSEADDTGEPPLESGADDAAADVTVPIDAGSDADSDQASPDVANIEVYLYGKLNENWQDDSHGATSEYADESVKPESSPYEIKVSLTGKGGAWGARVSPPVDTSLYQVVYVALQPTVANQNWSCYVVVSDGGALPSIPIVGVHYTTNYPMVGVWAGYRIPLSDLHADAADLSAVVIQDTSGLATNVWYVDNVSVSN